MYPVKNHNYNKIWSRLVIFSLCARTSFVGFGISPLSFAACGLRQHFTKGGHCVALMK